jgi:hypothetical protein
VPEKIMACEKNLVVFVFEIEKHWSILLENGSSRRRNLALVPSPLGLPEFCFSSRLGLRQRVFEQSLLPERPTAKGNY